MELTGLIPLSVLFSCKKRSTHRLHVVQISQHWPELTRAPEVHITCPERNHLGAGLRGERIVTAAGSNPLWNDRRHRHGDTESSSNYCRGLVVLLEGSGFEHCSEQRWGFIGTLNVRQSACQVYPAIELHDVNIWGGQPVVWLYFITKPGGELLGGHLNILWVRKLAQSYSNEIMGEYRCCDYCRLD